VTADTVVVGGLVVDGTGAAPFQADVAITDGVISAIGTGLSGRRTIDAADAWVTPGFVDPHTHLDAQLFWDPTGRPSVQHGVTTVFIGACGFGIAPCADGAEEYLLRSLEAVEEIPYADMQAGVPFGWHTFGEYLGALDALPLGVNVGALVPHSPLRHSVLGDDAAERSATPAEIRDLIGALDAALTAGAFGFASSRGPNHVDGNGRPVPSRAADDSELEALVARCAGRVWQINVKSKGDPTGRSTADEVAVYAEWSSRHGVALSWTPLLVPVGTDGVGSTMLADQALRLTEAGTAVYPQVCPMPMVTDISLIEPSILRSIPVWAEFAAAVAAAGSSDARATLLGDDTWRSRLREVPENPGSLMGPVYDRWVIGASPSHPELAGRDLASIADDIDKHPIDVMLDVLIDDGFATVIQAAVVNLDQDLVSGLVRHDGTLIGLGDAGAHVRSITNYSYPTSVLHGMVLGERSLSIEHAVRLMTSRPAEIFGLTDRGVLRVGAQADLCVIDPNSLHPGTARISHDLPAGGGRLMQTPRGMRAVLVNGELAVHDDQPTNNRTGQLLRRR
jgi:N-acyl-D-amino-acid deacylase